MISSEYMVFITPDKLKYLYFIILNIIICKIYFFERSISLGVIHKIYSLLVKFLEAFDGTFYRVGIFFVYAKTYSDRAIYIYVCIQRQGKLHKLTELKMNMYTISYRVYINQTSNQQFKILTRIYMYVIVNM